MQLKIEGRITHIGQRETKKNDFVIRQYAIETDGPYPQPIKFQLTQDHCDILDNFEVGQHVISYFNIRGNLWNGKILNNLQVWKIEGQTQQAHSTPPQENSVKNDDDLPF